MEGKLAFLKSVREIEIRTYEVPKAKPGGIVVKVRMANLCGSEITQWMGKHPVIKKDFVLGHEAVVEIIELGGGVVTDYAGQPIKVGDRIVATYFLTCGKCDACAHGNFALCHNAYKFLTQHADVWPHFHGNFATHWYIYPNQYFYKVPDELPDSVVASANCAISQVYYGIEKADLKLGEYILIQGAGGLGLYAAAIAKEKGAKVIMSDSVKERLELGKRFGADHVIDINEYPTLEAKQTKIKEIIGGRLADVGLEVAGVATAFAEGLNLLAMGGRYIEIGTNSFLRTCEMSPAWITRNALTVIGCVRYDPWYLKKSLDFLEATFGKYPYEELSDKNYTLEETQELLEKAERREVTRGAIVPN